jgi:hypothetical protein
MKQPCVYLLASSRNGTLYVGVTSDVVKRIWQRREGLVEGIHEALLRTGAFAGMSGALAPTAVTPADAGVQWFRGCRLPRARPWIPAFAGMTDRLPLPR